MRSALGFNCGRTPAPPFLVGRVAAEYLLDLGRRDAGGEQLGAVLLQEPRAVDPVVAERSSVLERACVAARLDPELAGHGNP